MRPLPLLDDLTAPEGFQYHRDVLTGDEEARLLDEIRRLEFHEVRMRGVAAKRRVVQYGWKYSFESFRTSEGPPLPEFLIQVQQRAAALAGVAPDQLSEALITEYSPGAAIGWHRDAPPFGIVIGISLLAACRFRFRRGRTGAWDRAELTLEPRSAYVLTGPARYDWQHSIPAVDALRYSVTFRTMALESRSRQE
jgi:DNA oxidative demethylase